MKAGGVPLIAFGLGVLAGCSTGTGHMVAQTEERAVQAAAAITSELPIPSRSECVRQRLYQRKADPSRLTIAVNDFRTRTVGDRGGSGVHGHEPQPMLDLAIQDAIGYLGFNVPYDAGAAVKAAADTSVAPKSFPHGTILLDGAIVAFSPLTKSVTGRDDADLIVPEWAREKLVARGSVTAIAVLYAPTGDKLSLWASASSTAIFFQVKNTQKLNMALKTGVAGGTATETIEVTAVQDVSMMVARDAAVKVIDKALGLNCQT